MNEIDCLQERMEFYNENSIKFQFTTREKICSHWSTWSLFISTELIVNEPNLECSQLSCLIVFKEGDLPMYTNSVADKWQFSEKIRYSYCFAPYMKSFPQNNLTSW